MSRDPYFHQRHDKYDLRHKRHDQFPPPRDPVKVARAEGRVHRNESTGFVLFAQSPMPVGEHIGKDMARVPKADLLRYGTARDFERWPEWAGVVAYVRREMGRGGSLNLEIKQ